jgi:NADH dehydrogenase
VLWAAGISASPLGETLHVPLDRAKRVLVNEFLNPENLSDVFAVGDGAACPVATGSAVYLPGLAPVAMQQGRYVAREIIALAEGRQRLPFRYLDKGMLATIGRKSAVLQFKGIRMGGLAAWLFWMLIHIWYLVGFRNKLFVYIQWSWQFLSYRRGARLIVEKNWHLKDS